MQNVFPRASRTGSNRNFQLAGQSFISSSFHYSKAISQELVLKKSTSNLLKLLSQSFPFIHTLIIKFLLGAMILASFFVQRLSLCTTGFFTAYQRLTDFSNSKQTWTSTLHTHILNFRLSLFFIFIIIIFLIHSSLFNFRLIPVILSMRIFYSHNSARNSPKVWLNMMLKFA